MASYAWVFWVGWSLVGVGALSLVAWLIGRSAKDQRRCPKCDYDLAATAGLTRPECGLTHKHERVLHRRRRRRRTRRVGLLVLLIGAGMLVFNPGRAEGWAASIPDVVIWPLMPLVDDYADEWIARYEAARTQVWPGGGTVGEPIRRWERLLRSRRYVRNIREVCALELDAAEFASRLRTAEAPLWNFARSRRGLGVSPRYIADELITLAEQRPDTDTRISLLRQLSGMGGIDRRNVARLRAMLDSEQPALWKATFPILAASVADGRALTPEILVGFDVVDAAGRAEFFRDLYDLAPLEDIVLHRLREFVTHDPDDRVRGRAAAVLSRTGPGNP